MRSVLLDTNVVISFLTDRDLRQQDLAGRLFESASKGEFELILHQMILFEAVYVLRNLYSVKTKDIAAILKDLLGLPGVRSANRLVWPRILTIWPERIPDLADAALASVAIEEKSDAIATFDADFAKRLKREGLSNFWAT